MKLNGRQLLDEDDFMAFEAAQMPDSCLSVVCDACNFSGYCLCTTCRSYYCQSCFEHEHRHSKHSNYSLNVTIEVILSRPRFPYLDIYSKAETEGLDIIKMRDTDNIRRIHLADYQTVHSMPMFELEDAERNLMTAKGRRYVVLERVNYRSLVQIF